MIAANETELKSLLRKVLIEVSLAVIVIAALVIYGLLRFPTTLSSSSLGLLSLLGLGIILLMYEVVTVWELPAMSRTHPVMLPLGLLFGAGIGLLFAVQMLVEYLLPISSSLDSALAVVTFGGVFLLFFVCGLIGGLCSDRFLAGVFAALWSAMAGSLIWLILFLVTYYFFLGTAMEAHFLEIDQTLADFQRSGIQDLRAYILQDYLAGGFLHLLISPFIALVFGALGSLIGKAAGKLLLPNFK